MNRQEVVKAFAIAAVALPTLLLGASMTASSQTITPVPKATCGRMDRTETGLQGQTTPDERSSGRSERGYNCNLELVGQFQGEGAFSQDGPAFLDNCAYYATENRSGQKHPGVVVLDVSDPRHPQPTAYLDDTPAGRNPHETLKVNEARKLLAVAENNGPNFSVYDLSADCRHPVLKSSITLPGSQAHMGGWAPDGKTYYVGQNNRGIGGTLPVVLNAANEIAVEYFLDGKLGFMAIPRVIQKTMDEHDVENVTTLDVVRRVDAWARKSARHTAQALELNV